MHLHEETTQFQRKHSQYGAVDKNSPPKIFILVPSLSFFPKNLTVWLLTQNILCATTCMPRQTCQAIQEWILNSSLLYVDLVIITSNTLVEMKSDITHFLIPTTDL